MSPPKRATGTADKLAQYCRQDKDLQPEDGADTCSDSEPHADGRARVLDAIAALQGTLTAKIDEVKIDISLLRQDLSKVKDRVTETETRIGTVEDIMHPMRHAAEDMQRRIQQLHSHQGNMENRLRRCNLRFIGLPEKEQNLETYLESLLIQRLWQGGFLRDVCGGEGASDPSETPRPERLLVPL